MIDEGAVVWRILLSDPDRFCKGSGWKIDEEHVSQWAEHIVVRTDLAEQIAE